MTKTTTTTPIRDLMPEGYIGIISGDTGSWAGNISDVVRNERTGSSLWPHVEKLAKKSNAKAYKERMEFLKQRDADRKVKRYHSNAA